MKSQLIYKSKKFTVLILKVLVICLAFYFIYTQIQSRSELQAVDFYEIIKTKFTVFSIIGTLLFTIVNYALEILKWKTLISYIQKISFYESLKQTCSGMTFAAFTPNGIGEYGAKILYFEKKNIPTILTLNFLANGIQMAWTCIFGLISLSLLFFRQTELNVASYLLLFLVGIPLLFGLAYQMKDVSFWGLSILKLISKIKDIPIQIHTKNACYALLRFIVFCHQYYFLSAVLGIEITYYDFMLYLCLMYFIASFIPSFQFFDVAVKGSIGVYLFSLLGVDGSLFMLTASIMWALNYVLPSLIGSFYVFQYRYKWS